MAQGSDALKVMTVVGTRPEAIKMIPVIQALESSRHFQPVTISTGQHERMVADLFASTGIKTDIDLRVTQHGPVTLNQLFSHVTGAFDRIWQPGPVAEPFRADGGRSPFGAIACMVHGDTTSAAAAAIGAFHLGIPVIHVEAGLRTSNVLSPFPEEGNRQLISRIAALHLAPTSHNKMNLIAEGIDANRIVVTGNTSIDMLSWAVGQGGSLGPDLEDLDHDHSRRIVLVTAHRRENWGAGIERISGAVAQLASAYPNTVFVVPMHPNPAVRTTIRSHLSGYANVRLIEPRSYDQFARLMARSYLAITDSGGVQEEAPALHTPVLVVRDTTERTEGVDAGTLELVGTDPKRIVNAASRLLDSPTVHAERGKYLKTPTATATRHSASFKPWRTCFATARARTNSMTSRSAPPSCAASGRPRPSSPVRSRPRLCPSSLTVRWLVFPNERL
ncbi:non-hydrolyzing UDP-N-acetylglucosamine 2-epimerase [Rarobacter incanus]|uniref:UDP-N-acetylglucosamine 2-epimerase (non-hydrolyzing) n=1 Tax=Rarobacter incanus TaxID=153494 RepID=A0A542SM64_9MICO|nr:UDP-N-acetylglucosamine 2-epimerase (non-hydrolyzing) [Rarobacter incanus]TQK75730.1 UDP-N-acetylglucosamine 2-epimerase (non-hydrolysing) [Rarobacter incanus]